MRKKQLLPILVLLLSGSAASAQFDAWRGTGPIADTEAAIARAKIVLAPVDAASNVKTAESLTATREGDIWTVRSPVVCPVPTIACESATVVKLNAKDGSVVYMRHEGPPPVPGL